jgi:phosphate acetyltransferase
MSIRNKSFLESLKDRARSDKKTIVLPESLESRTLEAAEVILAEDISNVILIGNKEEIIAKAGKLDISKATFIDPNAYEKMDSLIDTFTEIRSSKGMTKEEATKILKTDPLYMGVMLVKNGIADGMVAGAINSTGDVLRPSLQILKTAKGTKIVSSFFLMVVPDCTFGEEGVFVFSDCGLVQTPTSEELAAIAGSASKSFQQLVKAEPIVAMLSHSTKGSAKHPDIDRVVEGVRLAKEQYPNLKIDGELQLDAAIIPEIGTKKAPDSSVAGHANVLVFPNIDAGNIGYKLVERLAKATAYGPLTQGIALPVNDLSRGCSSKDIVGVVAITAVQAQN